MRCLNCLRDGVATTANVCPQCGVHLPSLLRDLLAPGTLLHGGKYRLDYALGRGGFGITYRATHLVLDQLVAIKEFFPNEHALRDSAQGTVSVPHTKQETYQRSLKRFLGEGRLLAKLANSNVVRVQDLFEERSTGYLVMDLIAGRTLDQVMREGRLPEKQVWSIIDQLVSALDAVHRLGIYHLDIKPENVLLDADNRPILIDFGASRQGLGSQTSQSFTLEYAAPEVIAGSAVGAESDIFELGMMAYEMVTGTRAPSAMARLTANESWIPTGLGAPWQELLVPALKLKKAERPANVREWWKSQEPATPVAVPPALEVPIADQPNNWKKAFFITASVTFLAIIILLIVSLQQLDTNNRLTSLISQSDQAVRNLTAERNNLQDELRAETEKRKNLRARIAARYPLMTTGIRVFNSEKSDGQNRKYATSFTYSEVYYVNWELTIYNNLEEVTQGTLYFRYIRPDGTSQLFADKPAGYTGSVNFTIDPDTSKTIVYGHGNDAGTYFEKGRHRIEFWYRNTKIDEVTFTIT